MNFLQQTKLTKSEWDMIEKPLESDREKHILKMIHDGYQDPTIQYNPFKCIREFLNISRTFDQYIFEQIFKEKIEKLNKKNVLALDAILPNVSKKELKISKADKIKMKNSLKLFEKGHGKYESILIEFILLQELKTISKVLQKKSKEDYQTNHKYLFSVYTLHIIWSKNKESVNECLSMLLSKVLENHLPQLKLPYMMKNVSKYLEHNQAHQYQAFSLYTHQKDIYRIFREHKDQPKFVFYCAPTSSGKTLTPIALTTEYKVLFVCASKHIGLGLAKSAFSLKKKLGFAFGCKDIDQIRLNYNAINSYKMVGKRKLPDHSDGKNVELMICDLLSFESAMLYMKAFHPLDNIILFWDEPTIGLDVPDHKLHVCIRHNWGCHLIPNVVFSCATLPKQENIHALVSSFQAKHSDTYFEYIETHDQVSNIMIYDEYGNVLMPHMYYESHEEMVRFLEYQGCKYYKFYNGSECAKFLRFYNDHIAPGYMETCLLGIQDFHLEKIKECYVECLKQIPGEQWEKIRREYFTIYPLNTTPHENIGCNITTEHANSLTNGPTLYISDQVENICKYLLHMTKMDPSVLKIIQEKINANTRISEQLSKKRKDYEDKIETIKDNEKVMENMRFPPHIMELHREIESLENKIQELRIDNKFKPNTRDHYAKWNRDKEVHYDESDVYSSYVGDKETKEVMQLYTVHALYKILLLMGVGVFSNEIMPCTDEHVLEEDVKKENNSYVEIMKDLAEQKSLYLIIANSDYIYGTNYQFSHCYLGKDMKNMSQEKIIQCIGRIGRQDKNKHFSFRFRSKEQMDLLYQVPQDSIEAQNMNKLFV